MNKQGWTYKKLGEVTTKISDGSHNPPKGIDYSEYPMLSSKNVFFDCFNYDSPRYLSKDEFDLENKRTEISDGDILLTIVGTVGRTCCVKNPFIPFVLQRSVAVLKPKQSIIESRFLMYALHSLSDFWNIEAKGVAQKGIYLKQLATVPIPVPPIGEQERIVAELDLLQGIIEKKKEQLKAYDQLAQSIFYSMFGDPIDNPKGWEVKKLGRVCTFTQGIQVPVEEQHKVKREGDIQFLRIIDFTQGKEEEPRYVTNKNDKYVLHEREIAIVRYGTPGFICYGKNGAIANNLFKIKPNQNDMFDFYFMLYWLRSDAFQASVKNKQYGAALQAIKFNTIQGIGIILPPLSLQEEFAEKVEAIERQKALVQQSIEETQTMFDCTMDKYFG